MTQDADVEQVIRKLSEALASADQASAALSKDEMATVRDMIRAYSLLLSWGKLGRIVIWLVITAAAVKGGVELLLQAGGKP